MKTVRSFMILAGLSAVFLALSAAGARAQNFHSTRFAGAFTLPFEAQWGALALPAGDYTLQYHILDDGRGLVVVRGTAKENPADMILAGPRETTKAVENTLICIRQGNKTYVRGLELPAVGESVHFAMPHGVDVEAKILRSKLNHNANTQLTEVRIPIERVRAK